MRLAVRRDVGRWGGVLARKFGVAQLPAGLSDDRAGLAAETAGQRPRGLTTLLALPGALALVDPRLAQPPGMAALPALAARWNVHRMQTAQLLSEPVIDALAQRLRRHLKLPTHAVAV